jgi:glycosyltransferase involved in cell wall biosynthesis
MGILLRQAVPAKLAGLPADYACSPVRGWRVLHAGDSFRELNAVVEGQLAAGMKPWVVTSEGVAGPEAALRVAQETRRRISLLKAWQEVRRWRQLILQAYAELGCELVHAHCFAAGMAAVRNCPAVVYDLRHFVEQAPEAGEALPGAAWLARSFRVAEHFVFTRAAAVVVHSGKIRDAVCGRASVREMVFLVPDPIEINPSPLPDTRWLRLPSRAVTLFAAHVRACPEQPAEDVLGMLRAFRQLRREAEEAFLLLEADPGGLPALTVACGQLELADAVRPIDASQREQALASADVVISGSAAVSMAALAQRRALLAADVPENREVSGEGRGCLWFRSGDARDLTARAAFLVRNPDFRRALASAGQKHLAETRSPEAVARAYDAVYRFAFNRRRKGGLASPLGGLQPIESLSH